VADEFSVIDLKVPRHPRTNEALQLEITTRLPPRARLIVFDDKGEVLGAVTPFELRPGSTTATIPLPAAAFSGARIRLRLQISEPHQPPRAPRDSEIERLEVSMEPQ
jgi:hypothetical protein